MLTSLLLASPATLAPVRGYWPWLLAFLLPALRAQAQITVTSVVPARATNTASPTANVVLTYSQALKTATAANLRVFSAQRGGQLVRGGNATASSSTTITVNPAQDFRPGETVMVTSPATVQSSGGAASRSYVYQFTTATSRAGSGTFALGSDADVGTTPNSAVLGDVDGDGDPDLLATNKNSNTVSVRLNQGSGTFGGGSTVSVGASPNRVTLGDVDGDGDLDLLTPNYNGNTVSVRLNQGGTFGGGSEVSVGSHPYSVALGDVDGDGDLDLLAANSGTNTVSVRLNQGNGTFSGSSTVSVGDSPQNVALGDVDGDGDLDLLTANQQSNTVSVRLNQGNGTFSEGSEVSVGSTPGSVALGDVDGDGDLDLLAANQDNRTAYQVNSTVSVRLNQGNGTFSGGSEVGVGGSPLSVTVGDVDGDGDLDLLAANFNDNNVSVRLNQGNGTFGGGSEVSVGRSPSSVALGDVDGDGDLDLLAANINGSSVSVRLNQPVAPVISSLSPTSGPVGTQVTITGTNLTGATAVSFNGTAASVFTVANSTTLTATVPAGATSGNVTVTTPGGPSNGLAFVVTTAPTVTTTTPTSITTTGAVLGGNVTADGGTVVTDRGVVYSSTNTTPTIGGTDVTKNANGSGTGSYSKTIASLTPGTIYSVRAYATNGVGTSYGTALRFTTVAPTITVAPATLAGGAANTPYSQTLSASGGTAPYTFALTAGALPPGLALSAAGTLSGTPTASGSFNFTVTATDASAAPGPYGGARAYTLAISYPNLVISTSNQTVPAGTYNSITVQRGGVGTLAGNVLVNGDVTVQSGGVLNDGCALISGPGSFTLAAGGTLSSCSAQGLSSTGATGTVQVTGTRSLSTDALYTYNGTVAQSTGTGLPATVRALTLSNPAGLNLTNALTTTTAATFTSGVLTTGANTLTLGSGATLGEDADSYVTGTVQATRSLNMAGSPEAFGGLGLMLTPSGNTLPGSTLVRRTTGTALNGTGSSQSVRRYFDIQPTTKTGLNVALTLTVRDDERNGIAPANLRLFKSEDNGGTWQPQPSATFATTAASGSQPTTYTASLSGISSFSRWTLGDAANPLPVELVAFTAQAEGTGARLRWTTASELHNDHFEVESSADGATFSRLGTVAGAGSSTQAHAYTYLDASLASYGASLVYYRLRQVDTDGTAHYSPVRPVAVSGLASLSLFPNPAPHGAATLTGAAPGAAVRVLDALGRVVATATADAVGTVALSGLAPGLYVVQAGSSSARLAVE